MGLPVPSKLTESGKFRRKVIVLIGRFALPGKAQFIEEDLGPQLLRFGEFVKMLIFPYICLYV